MSSAFTPEDLSKLLNVEGVRPSPGAAAERSVSLGVDKSALRTGDHAALLYWRPDELLDTVVPYVKAGLEAGDKVVYVADDLTVERVTEALGAAGIDVAAASAVGKLVLVQAKDAFFAEGRFDVERALAGVRALADQAAADGYRRVRFSVEMTYLLANVPGIEQGVEFEARANDEIFARYPFVCVCSFNAVRAPSAHIIQDVLRTHPILISGGTPLLNPHYRPWL